VVRGPKRGLDSRLHFPHGALRRLPGERTTHAHAHRTEREGVRAPEGRRWLQSPRSSTCAETALSPHTQRVQNGAPIQKLFPGVAGGPAFVKAVSAALPMLKINPTVRPLLNPKP
jgi:hypothetical protein